MKYLILSILLMSCAHKYQPKWRSIASDEPATTVQMLDDYYLLQLYGHAKLVEFDALLEKNDPQFLESQAYAELQVIRSRLEIIQDEFLETSSQVEFENWSKDREQFIHRFNFMVNLHQPWSEMTKIKLDSNQVLKELANLAATESNMDFIQEIQSEGLAIKDQYQTRLSSNEKTANIGDKFFPSIGKKGNIIGSEFPSKVWSLTYDDGPGVGTSKKIIQNLKNQGLRATFFQLTKNVEQNSEIAFEIKDAGMEIAAHSYDHKQLTKVGPLELEKQITKSVKSLEDLHKVDIKFFRLPYGAGVSNATIRQKIADNNLIHVFWSVDTLDWKAGSTPNEVFERTIRQMKLAPRDAGVILFHDIHERTVSASLKVMEYLKKDSRRVCTLDEITTQMNSGVDVCPLKTKRP